MAERSPHIPDAELEGFLIDTGRWVAYPATPDFARNFETRPDVADGLLPTDNREVWRPPTGRFGIHAASAESMDDRPRSRKRQALRLAGAAAAFTIVGLTLVLLFRELDDGGQAGGGVPAPPPTDPLLIAVSSEGPVTAIDPETGAVRYIVDGGYQPDAILSPDGTRLYVAGDDLSAHDARTGEEIWRVPYQFRQMWTVDQSAPSTLAIAPDGTRLYLASYDQKRGTSPDANTIPHFVQTFDTANGENLGESEAIRGGCTVPLHPSQNGQLLHAPCDGSYSVYELQSGSLQPPPSGRVIISASAQHDDELLLVSSSGIVQVVDMSSVAIVRDATLQFDGQVSPGLLALSVDGSHLYVGVSTSSERFFADQVLVFDTETWQQNAQFTLEEPLLSRDLTIDREGAVYGASTSYVAGTSIPVSSTVWRMNPETGIVEAVAGLAAQEVAHVLLGYVPVRAAVDVQPTEQATPEQALHETLYVNALRWDDNGSGGSVVTGGVNAVNPIDESIRFSLVPLQNPDIAISSDQRLLYIATLNGLAAHDAITGKQLWNVTTNGERLRWHLGLGPSTVAVSPNDEFVVILDKNNLFRVYDAGNGAEISQTTRMAAEVCAAKMHFSSDSGRLYAVCEAGNHYFTFELSSGATLPAAVNPGFVAGSASLPGRDELIIVSVDGEVTIITMSTGAVLREAELEVGARVTESKVALSPDGSRLYLGVSTAGTRYRTDEIRIYDTATWQELGRIPLDREFDGQDLAVDAHGRVFVLENVYVEGTSIPEMANIWRIDPATTAVERAYSQPAQEVFHFVLTLGDQPGPLPTLSTPSPTVVPPPPTATLPPTPTPDVSETAIEAALAQLPVESIGCQTTPGQSTVIPDTIEFEGIALIGDGNLEAIFYSMDERDIPPIRAGQSVLSYWAIARDEWRNDQFMSFTATELDAGTQISADMPATVGTSTWRTGATVWHTFFTFPHAGCWRIVATTEDYAGALWLTVEDESSPASPTPTVDTSVAAIEATLAALPAESKGCQVTPGLDGDAFGWEVRGVTLIGEGELWMGFVGNGEDYLIPPLQVGRSTSVYWNIGGPDAENLAFVELTATELGAGTQIGPDGPQNAGESPFFEGVMWKSYFTFPQSGCWQVIVERAGYAGVLWLTVADAP